jgi:hypothetical protein
METFEVEVDFQFSHVHLVALAAYPRTVSRGGYVHLVAGYGLEVHGYNVQLVAQTYIYLYSYL